VSFKLQLKCDLCHKKFNPVYSNKAFTWEYDFQGIERIYCVKCSKKNAQRATRIEKKAAPNTSGTPIKRKLAA